MPILLLIRHGRTAANTGGILSGWTPGVGLDDVGQQQANELAERLTGVPIRRIVASPLERTLETASALAAGRDLVPEQVEDIGECRYGAWTGLKIADLAKDPLWPTVQRNPSAVVFPDSPEYPGESLPGMAARAIAAVRRIDAEVARDFGADACWVAVSHGDVIKAIVGDAVGTHLDQFQRIQVDPASVSVIRYAAGGTLVHGVNGSGADVGRFTATAAAAKTGEGSVGGGAGAPAVEGGDGDAHPVEHSG